MNERRVNVSLTGLRLERQSWHPVDVLMRLGLFACVVAALVLVSASSSAQTTQKRSVLDEFCGYLPKPEVAPTTEPCAGLHRQARKTCGAREPAGMEAYLAASCPLADRSEPWVPTSKSLEPTKPSPVVDAGVSWETALVYGTASFLADRAKQEAVAAFVDKVGRDLCGTPAQRSAGYGYLKYTCDYFEAVQSDPGYGGSFVSSLSVLRAAVQKDLARLPLSVLDQANLDKLTVEQQDLVQGLVIIIAAVQLIESGEHPKVALDHAGELARKKIEEWRKSKTLNTVALTQRPLTCSIAVSATLSHLTFNTSADRPYSVEQLERVIQTVRDGFKGGFWDTNCVVPVSKGVGSKAEDFLSPAKLKEIHASLLLIYTAYEKLKAAPKPDAAQYGDFVEAWVRAASRLGVPKSEQIREGMTLLLAVLDASRDSDTPRLFAASMRMFAFAGVTFGAKGAWVGKLPMLAELGAAKTPDDVKRVLESAAVPVGGWKAKRAENVGTIAISGFVGLQGGFEWVGDLPAAAEGGLWAPLGIDYSRGRPGGSSLQVMLSVIDLGAFLTVADRVGDEEAKVETFSSVRVAQLFSPGLYLAYGLPDSPFVLGLGGAMNPALREVTLADGEKEVRPSYRLGMFAAIDVTLLPF